jgi:hypothetical protein
VRQTTVENDDFRIRMCCRGKSLGEPVGWQRRGGNTVVATRSAQPSVTADSNLCKRTKGYRRITLRRGDVAERERLVEPLIAWGAIRKRTEVSRNR